MDPDLEAAKRAARGVARAVRGGCDPGAGVALAGHVLAAGLVPAGAVVAGFWPMGNEIDLRPLLHALHAQGCRLALPRIVAAGQALDFRQWQPDAALVPGPFGTMHSTGVALQPDLFLVPLLAFDRQGGRLGYGGGYYDRSLAARPGSRRIGCAYAAQEQPHVPMAAHDMPMHAVATECGIIDCAGPL